MEDAYAEIARIDARVKDKLLKRAKRLGMASKQDEIIELVEAWKRAAKRVSRHRKHGPPHKGR